MCVYAVSAQWSLGSNVSGVRQYTRAGLQKQVAVFHCTVVETFYSVWCFSSVDVQFQARQTCRRVVA